MSQSSLEQIILKLDPRYGIPVHVCTCGAKSCLSLREARKRYPLPWNSMPKQTTQSCFKHPTAQSVRTRLTDKTWGWRCYECGEWLGSTIKPNDIADRYRLCKSCGLPSRVTTAGCDRCDVEDK